MFINAFILGLLYKYVLKMLIVNFKQFFLNLILYYSKTENKLLGLQT